MQIIATTKSSIQFSFLISLSCLVERVYYVPSDESDSAKHQLNDPVHTSQNKQNNTQNNA